MRMNGWVRTAAACWTVSAGMIGGGATAAAAAAGDSAWVQLFNGKDLKDWDFKFKYQDLNVDPRHTFKVVDGNLFVDYSEYVGDFTKDLKEPYGHAGYKLRTFSYYLLRSTYQFVGKQVTGGQGWANENNGFMLHSQSIASMGHDQDFPISLEAQLLGPKNGSGTMNLCTPGTNYHDMSGKLITDHCTNAKANARQPEPAWTTVSALVLGDSLLVHMVGKDTVLKYTKPVTGGGNVSGNTVQIVENKPLKEGYIVIQAESAPIKFKSIEILDLVGCMDKTKSAYRSYFVKNDPAACNAVGVNAPGARSLDAGRYLQRSGNRILAIGEGARLIEVRRTDGSLVAHFPEAGPAVTSYAPADPAVYLVVVKSASGTGSAKVAVF